jgi:hypothetical protein
VPPQATSGIAVNPFLATTYAAEANPPSSPQNGHHLRTFTPLAGGEHRVPPLMGGVRNRTLSAECGVCGGICGGKNVRFPRVLAIGRSRNLPHLRKCAAHAPRESGVPRQAQRPIWPPSRRQNCIIGFPHSLGLRAREVSGPAGPADADYGCPGRATGIIRCGSEDPLN